jgi:prophage DNA circulation protein
LWLNNFFFQAAPTPDKAKAGRTFDGLDIGHKAIDFTPASSKGSNSYDKAVKAYLTNNPDELETALAHKGSVYHKAAMVVEHVREALKYFKADPDNSKRALQNVKDDFHQDAVKQALSQRPTFIEAFTQPNHPLHKIAQRLVARLKKITPYQNYMKAVQASQSKGSKKSATSTSSTSTPTATVTATTSVSSPSPTSSTATPAPISTATKATKA